MRILVDAFGNEELSRLLPKAEHVIITRAGHGSARENPQAYNGAVVKLLKNHSR